MSDEGIRKVADALVKSEADAELDQYRRNLEARVQGEKSAVLAISRSVEDWTGHQPNKLGQLPMVRNGELIGYSMSPLASIMDPRGEAAKIAGGVWAENTSVLKARLKSFKKLERTLHSAIDQISDMQVDTLAQIFPNAPHKPNQLEEKMVLAIGAISCVGISALIGAKELRDSITRCETELATRKVAKGRSREEARYRVAVEFAKLFAKLTGEKPTYSEDANGYHGKFSPALRDLFDAIGWTAADLEGPAKAACKAVSEADTSLPENERLGGLLGLASS